MSALDLWRGNRPGWTTAWEPFDRDFEQMFQEMDRFFNRSRMPEAGSYRFIPACDIEEAEGEYHLYMDVPGLDRDDIEIEVIGNTVKISGERKQEREEKGTNQYRLERILGRFSRSFNLPDGVKEKDIEATYENGVLCLSLPKAEVQKAKRISVKPGKPGFVAKLTSKAKSKASNE